VQSVQNNTQSYYILQILIKHFGELTSPRVDQSATSPTASWFVGELSCCRE